MRALWLAEASLYWSGISYPREPSFTESAPARGKPWANHKYQANQKAPCLSNAPPALKAQAVYIYLLSSVFTYCYLPFLNLCGVYYWLLWEEIYESNRGRWMKAFALWRLLISQPVFCVFAGCHSDVVQIVDLACKHNVCLMPYGGELWNHRR